MCRLSSSPFLWCYMWNFETAIFWKEMSVCQTEATSAYCSVLEPSRYWRCNSKTTPKLSSEMEKAYAVNAVFCDVTPCGSCKNRRLKGASRLQHIVFHLLVTANVVPNSLILSKLRWRRYFPLTRLFLHEPHGVTSKKTAFFIVTAVKTSNLTKQ
jgi:hypothetical protein